MDQEIPSTKDYRPGWVSDFLVSLVFLTRLPVRTNFSFSMKAVGSASRCFPLVGLLVGGISGGVFLGAMIVGIPVFVAAFLCLSSQILLTGALHEDAIGDVADGFGGGGDKSRKLEIMRDSRVGTYAVVALILTLGLKATAIASIEDTYLAFAIIVSAAVVSRGMMVWAMNLLPFARNDGLGASAGKPPLTVCLCALAFSIVIPLFTLGPYLGSVGLLCAIFGSFVMSMIAYRQIGGQTGDVLGSVQQVSEIFFFIALTAILS